jgi:formylmethanofuran dehydrogenase subunit B
VVAGLECDVAGIRAAIALARSLRGVIDHAASAATLSSLSVMQRGGWMSVSPAEVSRRCDLLLCVGSDLPEPWLNQTFQHREPPGVILLKGERAAERLGIISAIVAGAPLPHLGRRAGQDQALAARLQGARYGVAVWVAHQVDEPTLELLMRLVTRLNETTRFSAMPLPTGTQAEAANLVSGWMSGFPVRTAWASGQPVYDPWTYAAGRLIESGEADAAVWINTITAELPDWVSRLPTVALVPRGARPAHWPRVAFEVGRPSLDHDAILYSGQTLTFGWCQATAASDAPSVASIAESLRQGLEAMEIAA